MSNFYKLFLALLIPIKIFAQDPQIANQQASLFVDALVKGDYSTYADYIYPAYINHESGKLNFIGATRYNINLKHNSGYDLRSITIGLPDKFYRTFTSNETYCLLADTVALNTSAGIATNVGSLLAISGNRGQSWTFIPLNSFLNNGYSIQQLLAMFRGFNHHVKIPEETVMNIEPYARTVSSQAGAGVNSVNEASREQNVAGIAARQVYRIKNQLNGGYLNTQASATTPECSEIKPEWWSAMWTIEPVKGTKFVRIRNYFEGTYLNSQSGFLSSSDISSEWWTAVWSIEPVSGSPFVRLKNRYRNTYLSAETVLQCTDIKPESSAIWIFEKTDSPEPDPPVALQNQQSITGINQKTANVWPASSAVIGDWKIVNMPPTFKLNQIFRNTYLEFFNNKVGVSINDSLNTEKNVKLFSWRCNKDSLIIDTLYNVTQHRRLISGIFSIISDTLTLKISADGRFAKQQSRGGNRLIIKLKKDSDDPFYSYYDYLPARYVKHKWLKTYQVKAGVLSSQANQFCDIHPSNNNFGEIITGPLRPVSDYLSGLNFIKYSFADKIFSATMLKINPQQTIADTTKHYEFYPMANPKEPFENVFCYFSDGIIIMAYQGGETLYLVNAGPQKWKDIDELHSSYLAHDKIPLPRFGVHYQLCNNCNDQGWFWDDDGNGMNYDASLKYSPKTAIGSSEFIKKGVVKINLYMTTEFIKGNQNDSLECSSANVMSQQAEWVTLPVKGTDYFLFKNKLTGKYLTVKHREVSLTGDGKASSDMWYIQISPVFDLHASGGLLCKIRNAANNEFLYISNDRLFTSFLDYAHLTTSMWMIQQLSDE